jgi:hypothetical protein
MQDANVAANEAAQAAEKQRTLVKSLAKNSRSGVSAAVGGKRTNDNKDRQQTDPLTSREVAREKAVLQQLEANAQNAGQVLANVKRLAAEMGRSLADGRYTLTVLANQVQTANDEAFGAVEKQRRLVKAQQTGRLSSREMAREKAVLQQFEANAKRAAEVLASVKRLAAEFDRKPVR